MTVINLAGKVAVVTGASRGIGRQIAKSLAAQSAAVALVARSANALSDVETDIRHTGGIAQSIVTDVSEPRAVAQLRVHLLETYGSPNIVINAAGVFGPIQLIANSDPEKWIETLMVNTVAPYLLCRAFVGDMLRAHWGRIINVSSAASLGTPGPVNSAYGTSKVALNQFTRHLAAEIDGTGVTVNVIHPGEVKTEMWATIRDDAERAGPEGEGYRRWARWVDETGGDPPQKAADLVLRLMGDEAATINGQFLWIEGGIQSPKPSW